MTFHKFRIQTVCLLIIFCSISCIQAQDELNINKEAIQKKANAVVEEVIGSEISPGLTIAVGVYDQTLFAKGYGKAIVEIDQDATTQTIYGITSITKQFTATAILKLMEQGKLDLEASVTTYIPEFNTQDHHVTVKQLLNHTSGTPTMRNTSSINESAWFSKTLSFQEMLEYFGDQPFEFKPGVKHSYNNFAYYLLGEIITRVSGMPWDQYMEQELFNPWNLSHTGTCDADSMPSNGARSYLKNKDGFLIAPVVHKSVLGAAGALCSTVEDLIRWNYYLYDGKIISPASLELLTSPTVLEDGNFINEGLGVYLEELGGEKKIAHGGALPWGAYLSYYPKYGLSIAVLTNSAKNGRNVAEDIEKALAQFILKIESVNIELTLRQKQFYEGNYVLKLGDQERNFKIFVEQDNLMAQLQGQQAAELVFQGNQTFSFLGDPDIRLVFKVDQKNVQGVTLFQKGREIPGMRKE